MIDKKPRTVIVPREQPPQSKALTRLLEQLREPLPAPARQAQEEGPSAAHQPNTEYTRVPGTVATRDVSRSFGPSMGRGFFANSTDSLPSEQYLPDLDGMSEVSDFIVTPGASKPERETDYEPTKASLTPWDWDWVRQGDRIAFSLRKSDELEAIQKREKQEEAFEFARRVALEKNPHSVYRTECSKNTRELDDLKEEGLKIIGDSHRVMYGIVGDIQHYLEQQGEVTVDGFNEYCRSKKWGEKTQALLTVFEQHSVYVQVERDSKALILNQLSSDALEDAKSKTLDDLIWEYLRPETVPQEVAHQLSDTLSKKMNNKEGKAVLKDVRETIKDFLTEKSRTKRLWHANKCVKKTLFRLAKIRERHSTLKESALENDIYQRFLKIEGIIEALQAQKSLAVATDNLRATVMISEEHCLEEVSSLVQPNPSVVPKPRSWTSRTRPKQHRAHVGPIGPIRRWPKGGWPKNGKVRPSDALLEESTVSKTDRKTIEKATKTVRWCDIDTGDQPSQNGRSNNGRYSPDSDASRTHTDDAHRRYKRRGDSHHPRRSDDASNRDRSYNDSGSRGRDTCHRRRKADDLPVSTGEITQSSGESFLRKGVRFSVFGVTCDIYRDRRRGLRPLIERRSFSPQR